MWRAWRARLWLLLPQLSQQVIRWGNPSCWNEWRIYELCCYPQRLKRPIQMGARESLDYGFHYGQRNFFGNPTCWNVNGLNESDCCRPQGAFFQVDRNAPAAVTALFSGCQMPGWQSFLFKLRMSGGVLWVFDARILAWFYDFDFGMRRPRRSWFPTRMPERCPIGASLYRIFVTYLAGDNDFFTGWGPLPSADLKVLELAEAELKPFGGLFTVLGVSWHQLKYLRLLYSLQNRYFSGDPQRSLAPPPENSSRGSLRSPSLALDFGASHGVDAEMMLRQGMQVVAVEGRAEALRAFRDRLALELPSAIHKALTIVHAASGGKSVPGTVEFQVDHHHKEKSTIFDAKHHGARLVDAHVEEVPQKSCGLIYREHVPRAAGGATYAKIDIEGADLDCLGSLLRNSTRGWLLPRFVSIEMPGRDKIYSDLGEWQLSVLGMMTGRYCHAKLCRQHIYNIRSIEGRGLVSRLGWGASGPFGDRAVDWRRGEAWAPLKKVLKEVYAASDFALVSGEWFDLHLRRC